MERDEYIRRWRAAALAIFWSYCVPLTVVTWLYAGLLLLWQPAGRVGIMACFVAGTMVLLTVTSFCSFCWATGKAHGAERYSCIWRDSYQEPWRVGQGR